MVKNLPVNVGSSRDTGLIPRSGSFLRRRKLQPLQFSCLENFLEEPGRLQFMDSQRVRHHLVGKQQQQYVRVSLEHAVWGKKDEEKKSVRKIDFS